MEENAEDAIIIEALLKRFTEQRLPKALELREKVFSGGKLNEFDVKFLDSVFTDAKYIFNLSDKYPEYQEIVTKAIQLYCEITEKALENEKEQED